MSVNRIFTTLSLAALWFGSAGIARAASVTGSATLPGAVLPFGSAPVVVQVTVNVNTKSGGTLGLAVSGGGSLSAIAVDAYSVAGEDNVAVVEGVITSSSILDVSLGATIYFAVQDNGPRGDQCFGMVETDSLGTFIFYEGPVGSGNFKVAGRFPLGCFTAGTRITMADGSEKPIEQIEVGDRVLGPDGEVNRVIDIQRPLLGDRKLYGLNGGKPFVTSGHPFMTQEGWKSIDPTATAAENPSLTVATLKTGDALTRVQGIEAPAAPKSGSPTKALAVRLAPMTLERVEGRPADPKTQLYNLRLDGSHVYFANGYLVHNK